MSLNRSQELRKKVRQVIAKLFLMQLDRGLHLFLGDVDAARLQDVLRGRGTLRGPLR